MKSRLLLLLAVATVTVAAPAKEADDLVASEGRNLPVYSAPGAYGGTRHGGGGGTVTSYNRRGSYSEASEFSKPSIYGSSYGAPYGSRSSGYAPLHRESPAVYGAQRGGYGDFGPQANAYSAQSQHLSQDPSYDPAKDPVSQYADYIPVREYGPKGQADGKELSIYGYKK